MSRPNDRKWHRMLGSARKAATGRNKAVRSATWQRNGTNAVPPLNQTVQRPERLIRILFKPKTQCPPEPAAQCSNRGTIHE